MESNYSHRWTEWEFLTTPIEALTEQKSHKVYSIFMPENTVRNPYRKQKNCLIDYNINAIIFRRGFSTFRVINDFIQSRNLDCGNVDQYMFNPDTR